MALKTRKLTDREINLILHALRTVAENQRSGAEDGCNEESGCDHFIDSRKPWLEDTVRLADSIGLNSLTLEMDEDEDEETTDPKPYKINISWGCDGGNEPIGYEFSTKEEIEAFVYGVQEANGWLECNFVGEKHVWISTLEAGDKVKWTDPDGGICDKIVTIDSIKVNYGDDSVQITDTNGDDLEAQFDELEQVEKGEDNA